MTHECQWQLTGVVHLPDVLIGTAVWALRPLTFPVCVADGAAECDSVPLRSGSGVIVVKVGGHANLLVNREQCL